MVERRSGRKVLKPINHHVAIGYYTVSNFTWSNLLQIYMHGFC